MKRKIVKAIKEATSEKLDKWFQDIATAITQKDQNLLEYETKRKLVINKFLEAEEKGISARELERITGIPHQTISKWISEEKAKNAQKAEPVASAQSNQ